MSDSHEERLRSLVSQEAARIIVNEGVKDFHLAKHKAATRLKLPEQGSLPGNSEIERALRDHQTLFHAAAFTAQLRNMREVAKAAMKAMEEFEPLLTGGVLHGTAGPHDTINLHLFSDASEEVLVKMLQLGIPYEARDKRFRWNAKEAPTLFPTILFSADQREVELAIFPTRKAHQAPLSPIDGKPMKRVDIRKLSRLLESDSSEQA